MALLEVLKKKKGGGLFYPEIAPEFSLTDLTYFIWYNHRLKAKALEID